MYILDAYIKSKVPTEQCAIYYNLRVGKNNKRKTVKSSKIWLEVKSQIQEVKSFTFKTGSKFNALTFKSR